MSTSLLDRAIYTHADVDRLVGLAPGTARRWLQGYTRKGTLYPPVLRPESTGDDEVTWGEMVEARLLAEFRYRQVSVQRMRPAIAALRDEFGPYPLAHARPFLDVEGRELVRVVQAKFDIEPPMQLVVVRSGQLVLAEATERFTRAAEYDTDVVSRLRPRVITPDVVMDPLRSFGQPTIGHVRTEVLAEAIRAGEDRHVVADLFDVTLAQLDKAIQFELIASHQLAS